MKSYKDFIDYINRFNMFGIKLGLKRMNKILEYMDNPQKNLNFIHVAGTNGKGSTATMISQILKDGGYKTGLYTSPGVIDIRERIQINNKFISKEDFMQCGFFVKNIIQDITKQFGEVTEFEFMTAIAFEFFNRQCCDIVVLEVGMGGRLDATNVISSSLVSVITSISLDHVNILGNSIKQIAREKCGIIKSNGTTVVSPNQRDEVLEIIREKCMQKNNEIICSYKPAIVVKKSIEGTDISYRNMDIHISMMGEHQIDNTITAIETALYLSKNGWDISQSNIYNGIKNSRLISRIQIVSEKPMIIIDGSHNESGGEALARWLELYDIKNIIAIIGMMKDKDVNKYLKLIGPKCKEIISVNIKDNDRALESNILAKISSQYCVKTTHADDSKKTYINCVKKLRDNDTLLVCGSLYLCRELCNIIYKNS